MKGSEAPPARCRTPGPGPRGASCAWRSHGAGGNAAARTQLPAAGRGEAAAAAAGRARAGRCRPPASRCGGRARGRAWAGIDSRRRSGSPRVRGTGQSSLSIPPAAARPSSRKSSGGGRRRSASLAPVGRKTASVSAQRQPSAVKNGRCPKTPLPRMAPACSPRTAAASPPPGLRCCYCCCCCSAAAAAHPPARGRRGARVPHAKAAWWRRR